MSEETKWRDIARSDLSARTVNQIRNVVDKVSPAVCLSVSVCTFMFHVATDSQPHTAHSLFHA
jgi:hypothetical protein